MKRIFQKIIMGSLCLSVVLGSVLYAPLFSYGEEQVWKIAIFRTAPPYAVNIERALKQALAELGYREGEQIEYLSTEIVSTNAKDLAETAGRVQVVLEKSPDVIVTIGTQASVPAWAAVQKTDIPMVFGGVSFPDKDGLIEAFGQATGKNISGVGSFISLKKSLELVRQIFPDTRTFQTLAFIYSSQVVQEFTYVKKLRELGDVAQFNILYIDFFDYAQDSPSMRLLLNRLHEADPDMVYGWFSLNQLSANGKYIQQLLHDVKKPIVGQASNFIDLGGIAGVFTDRTEIGHEQARMIAQILQGEFVGDIPPVEPLNFVVELNQKKARELNIQFEQRMIEAADRVIE